MLNQSKTSNNVGSGDWWVRYRTMTIISTTIVLSVLNLVLELMVSFATLHGNCRGRYFES